MKRNRKQKRMQDEPSGQKTAWRWHDDVAEYGAEESAAGEPDEANPEFDGLLDVMEDVIEFFKGVREDRADVGGDGVRRGPLYIELRRAVDPSRSPRGRKASGENDCPEPSPE